MKLHIFTLLNAIGIQSLIGDFEITETMLFIPHSYKNRVAEKWIRSHEEKYKSSKAIIFAVIL